MCQDAPTQRVSGYSLCGAFSRKVLVVDVPHAAATGCFAERSSGRYYVVIACFAKIVFAVILQQTLSVTDRFFYAVYRELLKKSGLGPPRTSAGGQWQGRV